jgi:hypothetical protein
MDDHPVRLQHVGLCARLVRLTRQLGAPRRLLLFKPLLQPLALALQAGLLFRLLLPPPAAMP